jgi:hypothetical protein
LASSISAFYSLGPSFNRLTNNPDPRNGDLSKNSTKFPSRRTFRLHSEADTTTTASPPSAVIHCGPQVHALSINSPNLALASPQSSFRLISYLRSFLAPIMIYSIGLFFKKRVRLISFEYYFATPYYCIDIQ